jgi:hypothetical protein
MEIRTDLLRRLPIAGTALLMAAACAIGLVYWTTVQQQQRYLASRNFRLLATLAGQTQNVLSNNARLVLNRLGTPREGMWVSEWIHADRRSPRRRATDVIAASGDARAAEVKAELHRYSLSVAGRASQQLSFTWRPPAESAELPEIYQTVAADNLLGPIFTPKLRQGAFDTLLLATPQGQVVYAAGRRQQELRAVRLGNLLSGTSAVSADDAFAAASRSIASPDVVLAGVRYRLFLQPCCRAIDDGAGAADNNQEAMLVGGLVEIDAIRSASMAVSPLIVLVAILFTLGALVGWPFLKLALIGAQQRVTGWDVLQLGASSVFGLALGTVVLLTGAAYGRFTADLDAQLETLASRLDKAVTTEVRQAYEQLRHLEALCLPGPMAATDGRSSALAEADTCPRSMIGARPTPTSPYPHFIAFALIDENGQQRIKRSTVRESERMIDVGDRTYFTVARDGDGPPVEQCDRSGCVVESVWSWTTGLQTVVISKPTRDRRLPVAALSFPMHGAIDPILPAGFEFAVVNPDGDVLFHSDAQRNVHENIIVESDHNQRLRALVTTRRAEALSVRYWGRAYRAYIRPSEVRGWTIVTLADKRDSRALVLEWTSVSLIFLAGYLLVGIVIMLVLLWMNTAWLWPDPTRLSRYRMLTGIFAGFLVVFALLAAFAGTRTLFYAGFIIPLIACLATFLALVRRPAAVAVKPCWSELHRAYALMGTTFLVLVAMAPGAAFVAHAYDLHIESYIKHRQIGVAHARQIRAERIDPLPADHPLHAIGVYDDFFYASRWDGIEVAGGGPALAAGHSDDVLLTALEDYLPYYAESSAEMRELLHSRAYDDTWASERRPGRRLVVTVNPTGDASSATIATRLPAFIGLTAHQGTEGEGVILKAGVALALLAGLVLLAYGIVAFVLRHVFLLQVVEPLWATGRLVAAVGDNLLVLCDPAEMADQFHRSLRIELNPIVKGSDSDALWRAERLRISDAGPGRAVVVTDIDKDIDDARIASRKLALIEELVADPTQTVVVLSQHAPRVLARSGRWPRQYSDDSDRWDRLLNSFVVLDRSQTSETVRLGLNVTLDPPSMISNWRSKLWGQDSPDESAGVRDWRHILLEQEAGRNRALLRICNDLGRTQSFQSRALTADQILDEIEERAFPYYSQEWNACTDEERVVLEHIARYGLATAASRRVVRRLLVKGLISKDPELKVMNQTFRRFILTPDRKAQVRRIEIQAEASVWDRLRWPLGLTAAAAALFLFTTQRETFNSTVAAVAGVSTAVPALVRFFAGLQRGGRGSTDPPVNV